MTPEEFQKALEHYQKQHSTVLPGSPEALATHTSPQAQTYSSPASPSVVTCGCGCVYYIMPDSTVQCNCGTQHVNGEFGLVSVVPYGSVEPVKKQKLDDAEERLRAKVIPAFRGEAMCDFSAENEVLRGAPREPWFGANNARTQQSMAVIKRWTATNLRSWPVGRFDRQPAKLAFYPRSETGGDGEYIRAVFECGCCR